MRLYMSVHKGKRAEQNYLENVMRTVNAVGAHAKNSPPFSELFEVIGAEYTKLLFHTEVWWLSRAKVLPRVLALKDEITAFFNEDKEKASKLQELYWLARLHYMVSVFEHLNKLNLFIHGKGGDIFEVTGKFEAFKLKLSFWKSRSRSTTFWTTVSGRIRFLVWMKRWGTLFSFISSSWRLNLGE